MYILSFLDGDIVWWQWPGLSGLELWWPMIIAVESNKLLVTDVDNDQELKY